MLFNYWLADCFGHASGQLTVCPLWCPMFTDLPGSFLAFSESFQLHINCFVSSFERHLFSSCLFYPFYYVNFLFSKKIYLFPKQGLFSWSILGLGHILFVSQTDLFCIYYPLLVFSPHIVVPSHEVTTVASAPHRINLLRSESKCSPTWNRCHRWIRIDMASIMFWPVSSRVQGMFPFKLRLDHLRHVSAAKLPGPVLRFWWPGAKLK